MPPDAPDGRLSAALLDSRARWRDLATLAADLLFETDAAGRFTFLAPEHVLGRPAAALLGTEARALLADPAGPDPFGRVAARGLRAWLHAPGGEAARMEFTTLPCPSGIRGAARDVSAEERAAEATARALRRATALGRLLGNALRCRGEGPPDAALCWKAGWPASLAVALQPALGIPPARVIGANAEGGWTLGPDELLWQLELMEDLPG